jgi:hypothetical protein
VLKYLDPIAITEGSVTEPFVVEHHHSAGGCPTKVPAMASGLLQLLSEPNARKHGITIHGDAVVNGNHHLYLILEAPDESAVREYLAPFGQVGSLEVVPASRCEAVVQRGGC